jgi:hypothetical protein
VRTPRILLVAATVAALGVAGCGSSPRTTFASGTPQVATAPSIPAASGPPGASATPSATASATPSAKPKPVATLRAGNPKGHASIPAAGRPVNTSHPDHVIGTGTPASCTSAALVKAVAAGGVITFKCGPAPVTITMTGTAKVRNDHGSRVVIDGGGLVTLSGAGKRRILYLDTCDPAQKWTTSHCDNQSTPRLTVQNITFTKGNSTGQTYEGGGGGAIFDRGGRLAVINAKFTDNRCDPSGPDLGGAAIRALSQYNNDPVYVVNSTFTDGICSNGGGLSSIGVSWTVLNCLFTGNRAIGSGANPAASGTPGGGSGAAIYNDGNTYVLTIAGTVMTNNNANEGGGAIFYVSNDRSGTMSIADSTLTHNKSGKFQNYPGIFFLGAHAPTFTHSTIK